MLERPLMLRNLSEVVQIKLALQFSQYNTLDKLVLSQHDNQLRLHGAQYIENEKEIEDYKMMARILEKAIKFSLH